MTYQHESSRADKKMPEHYKPQISTSTISAICLQNGFSHANIKALF